MIIKYEIDHKVYDNTLQVEYDGQEDGQYLVMIHVLKLEDTDRVFFTKQQCIILRDLLDMLIKERG